MNRDSDMFEHLELVVGPVLFFKFNQGFDSLLALLDGTFQEQNGRIESNLLIRGLVLSEQN